MDEKLEEIIKEHKSNVEHLVLITDYSIRCLYESLVNELVNIVEEDK